MSPVTYEQVEKEYQNNPYATPLEHIDNLSNNNSSSAESETESEEEEE